MSQKIKVAITQMQVTPSPLHERLHRAGKLVREAALQGAVLIVLPELFNTGYTYSDANFHSAREDGERTKTWMMQLSEECNIYLAGSFFFCELNKIYNRLYLTAAHGKSWQYDKTYPWGWERAYFQPGNGIEIADTALGRIGLMLCWDVAHADLWRQYAGKVDLILSCTCPPDIPAGLYCFPDGSQYGAGQLGALFQSMQHSAVKVFVETPAQQCRWLGVPYISSTGSGTVNTFIPNPKGSFLGALFSKPSMVRKYSIANKLSIQAEMVEAARVYNAKGVQIAQLVNNAKDEITIAEIEIEKNTKEPVTKQPAPNILRQVYWVSDFLLPMMSLGTYRRGLRKLIR